MVYNNNYCSIEDAWGNLTGPVPKEKKKKKANKDPICELYDMSTNASYDELEMVRAANSLEFDHYNKARYQKDRQASREKPKYLQIDISPDEDHVPLYEQNMSDDMNLEKQFASSVQNAQCSKNGSKVKLPDLESHFNPLTSDPHDDDASESEADYKEFKNILQKKKEEDPERNNDEEEEVPASRNGMPTRAVNESFYEDGFYGTANKRKPSNMAILDLLLYIVSGMILIFVMEQFVKIGLMLQQ